MNWRRVVLVAAFAGSAMGLAGCWSRRELKDVSVVLGLGFDPAPSGVGVTVQIPMAERIAGAASKTANSSATYVTTISGSIMRQADHELRSELPAPPNWSHLQIVVVGESLARRGVAPMLDFLLRYPGLRQTALMLVTPQRASDVLRLNNPLDPISPVAIESSLQSVVLEGMATESSIIRFADLLGQPGIDPVLPSVSSGSNGVPRIGPSAVFRDDRLVGWLNHEETMGLAVVRGKAAHQFVQVSCRRGAPANINVELSRLKSRILMRAKGGRLAAEVQVRGTGSVAENACLADITQRPVLTQLERLTAAEVRAQIEAAVRRAKELRTDVFGFGRELYRKMPSEWRLRSARWGEELAQLPVNVRVELKIDQAGSITSPLKPR